MQRNQSAAFSSGKVRPNHETNINIIARRTGKDVNSHTVLDGIITTIMATIQRINIIGSREGSRNRRRLKANQTGKKFRVGIKSNISTNRNNLCVYGTLDFVGYPRFPAPVEFIAAVIAYYVHPVNIQTACLIMEGAEFTENI